MPLAIALVVFAGALALRQVLSDGDTQWQVATGNWILAHRSIPGTDPFSFTAAGRPWVAHEWLAEVAVALAFALAGWAGVIALTALALGIAMGLLARHLHRFLPLSATLILLLLALTNIAPSLLARPHILALPCLELWCAGLVIARARRSAPPLSLLPLMTLWANLHGSFMVGLLLPVPLLLEAALDPGPDRNRIVIGWSIFLAGAWIAALITPTGLQGLLFPFRLLSMPGLGTISEWQPMALARRPQLEIIVAAALYFGLTGRVSLPRGRVLLFVALLHAALQHSRNGQLVAVVGALVLAEPLGRQLGAQAAPEPFPPAREDGSRPAWPLAGTMGMAALALLALRLANPVHLTDGTRWPVSALAHVPPALLGQPVLNDYSFGGYLILNGIRPFIDSRADMYGDAFLAKYRDIIYPKPDVLEQTLRDYRISWTILRADNRAVGIMDREPGWRRIYSDPFAIVHVRTDAEAK